MADIQYLNYGDLQIELLALLNNLANQVQGYVQSQPWSNKRKEKFMSAYSDLMNRGILGASNNTGQWMIDINGDPLPEMSRKDKEMYQEAAYFILQQMAALPTKTAEEEKKVEDLPVFDFNKDFITHVNNSINGGQPLNIGYGDSDLWNYLDERDSNGIRGRKNRAKKLAELLESYKTKLGDGSKYKFEGSPYSDINDFNTKIDRAIAALKTDSIDDDREALQAIGLNQATWFNNGSGDPSGKVDANGNPLTYGLLTEQQELKVLEELGLQEKLNQQNRIKNSGVLTISANNNPLDAVYNAQKYLEHLGTTYGVGQTGFNSINDKVQELLERSYNGGKGNGLNNAERKQLGNLIHYIRTNNPNYLNYNLSKQDEVELSKHESLKGKRLLDFIRLPWQTSDGRYTYADKSGNVYFLKPLNLAKLAAPTFLRSAAYNNYRNNFLSNTKKGIDKLLENYLKSIGFNDADIAELTGIGLDIASIVNPEPISAGLLGVGAAGARNYARTRDPKNWTFGDYATQAFDYITGAIGAIPGLGDLALAGKTAANVAKWGKRIMTIPAVWDMASHTPGATEAIKKAINGEDLTVEDWRNLGSFVRGLTATRNITVLNRAARRAMEKRGYDISDLNGILKRSGLWDTSVPKTQTTVKVNVKGKQEKIQISSESKSKLDKELKKAGNNLTKKDEAIRNVKEVKEYITNLKLKEKDITAVESSSFRNAKYMPRLLGTTKSNYGRTEVNKPSGNDTFEAYLSGDRGVWDRLKYGSNNYLRRIDRQLNLNSNSVIPQNNNTNINLNPTRILEGPISLLYRQSQVGRTNPAVKNSSELPENVKFNRETMNNYKNMINGNFSNNELQSGSYNLTGTPLLVVKLSDGTFNILFKGNVIANERNQREIQKTIRNLIRNTVLQGKSNSSSKISAKEMGRLLKEFKSKGWLKQGGTIDKQRMQRYKEFIKK